MQRADRALAAMHSSAVPAEDIERTGHRKSRDGKPAGQSLDIDQSECVGAAWKYEGVRGGISGGKPGSVHRAEEQDLRIARLELVQRGPAPDYDLASGHVEIEERADI